MSYSSLLVVGDSNVSYYGTTRQPWDWIARRSCGLLNFPCMIQELRRAASCPVAYVPLSQLRGLGNITLLLESTLSVLPKPTLVLILVGQNDADEWSRYSTRGPLELSASFRDTMARRVTRLDQMITRGGAQSVWILPFDDPSGQFTPLYLGLVSLLTEVVQDVTHHIEVALPLRFEVDQYHLTPFSRTRLAHWLWDTLAAREVTPPQRPHLRHCLLTLATWQGRGCSASLSAMLSRWVFRCTAGLSSRARLRSRPALESAGLSPSNRAQAAHQNPYHGGDMASAGQSGGDATMGVY